MGAGKRKAQRLIFLDVILLHYWWKLLLFLCSHKTNVRVSGLAVIIPVLSQF